MTSRHTWANSQEIVDHGWPTWHPRSCLDKLSTDEAAESEPG